MIRASTVMTPEWWLVMTACIRAPPAKEKTTMTDSCLVHSGECLGCYTDKAKDDLKDTAMYWKSQDVKDLESQLHSLSMEVGGLSKRLQELEASP